MLKEESQIYPYQPAMYHPAISPPNMLELRDAGMQLTGEVKFTGVFDIEVVRERERARALDIMSSLKNYLKEMMISTMGG
ncbi:hypothetical protein Y032_0012g1691 [Ancylostoma ceylanicum]|uniref:Uncharacterized protein n=1 Tax=Ancylostoma ceylanicum TaxID=53326 RepID=A0A016VBS4_9BILA|nr:hypothetical protein Y032_0012g1691 [Ancylostoma ceylanicum]